MKMNLYLTILFTLCLGMINAQVFQEDFEGGIPAGWAVDGGWVHGTSNTVSSQYFNPPAHTQFMAVNDDGAGQGVNTSGRVVTTPIDLMDLESPFVTFEAYFVNGDYQGADERALVEVSNDDGATWTEVASLNASNWAVQYIPLLDYVGETVLLSFTYDDGGGWNFGFCFDNVAVVNYDVRSDAELLSITPECGAAMPGVSIGMTGAMFNYAIDPVTSFDLHLQGDGVDTMVSITGLDVPAFSGVNFDIPYQYEVGEQNGILTATIVNLNTGDDEDMANNALNDTITSVAAKPGAAVIVEEATGTWCTWCPRGAVYLDRATRCMGDAFIGIAVHNNDPMAFAAYDDGVTGFPGFTGFPSVLFNRAQILDPSAIFDPIVASVTQDPTVLVDGTVIWDADNRTIDVEASATFMFDALSGYRFNAVIVEDSVTGTTSDYDQINAYAGGNFGPMGGYENLPNPVPASMMVYDHVARALLGGFEGPAGSIGVVPNGGTTTFAFDQYTLPAEYNADKVHVVIMVLDPQGRIINGTSMDLEESSNTFFVEELEIGWNVAPNPMSTQTTITVELPESDDLTLSVVDMLGRMVWSQSYENQYGVNTYTLDRGSMPAGMYNVILQYKGKAAVQKLVVD